MSEPHRPQVVVIGAGISGLAAAWELTGGEAGPTGATPSVTLLEASGRPGGKLAPLNLDGRVLDAGPDGALARRPEVADLCEELGLGPSLRPIAASGASVFARGRVRALPSDLALGVPTHYGALRRSKVLSWQGSLRALRDVLAPVPPGRGHLQDRTIGSLVETKLGTEVVTTLIDPMIGGINAGRVAEMSAAAIYPALLEAGQARGSLMKALRPLAPSPPAAGTDAPPAFLSLLGGMHSLAEELVTRLVERGARLRCGVEVTDLLRRGGTEPGWSVNSATTTTQADGVVLCAPAFTTSKLLGPLDDEVSSLLDQIDYATVAIATLTFAEEDLELPAEGTGVLIPPGSTLQGSGSDTRLLATALTFLDRKWPHLKREGEITLRVHCGRIDDDRIRSIDDAPLIDLLLEELSGILAVRGRPRAQALQRWDDALPQYRVNHLLRVAGIEGAVARLEHVEIAGASLHGIGVPACIASGRAAGRRMLESVTTSTR